MARTRLRLKPMISMISGHVLPTSRSLTICDIFTGDAVPLDAEDPADSYDPAEGDDILDLEQSRLSELFDLQDRRPLTEEEQVELNPLVAAWGRAVNERGIHELRRGGASP